MADLRDTLIGGFRILAEIKGASGSQGQIFKAVCEQPPFEGIEPGTVVALKAMAVHDEDGQAWAKLEKRTGELVRLSHPNVVKYYGCFSESGMFNDNHVIVQEFLDGETLKQRLARCPSGLDADEALRVTQSALAGLEYTAANGIVHRDVKPGNIFLCSDGRVKLIDFEVARQEGGTTTSASGGMVGSFDYMAPDFTNSTFRGDERSDVFSMGVVMHEAISGRTPYQRIEGGEGQANFAFLSRWARLHVDGTNPIRISSRANRLLAHSDEVLSKALAPLPEDRYQSFAEFRAGLKAIRYRDLRNGEMAYRILQIVGKGGFGEVFKARLKRTNQLVAIKHLLKSAYAERFYREAKIMARLDDPCFVRFVDFFVVDHPGSREAFLVMDFLPGMPGSSLRDAIKRAGGAALPLRETLLAFARYAHGLSAIHSQGIFHRDIKPSNLYFPEGHPERAAIMDLGIARDAHGSITTGQVPGTLDYMPPEVVLTDNRGESGMDIYALGLCLYEALSGKPAYPRLPQGPSALTAFFTRAKIKAMPDLSDPDVEGNRPLHALLVQMTNPELSERVTDTRFVERRLTELAEAAGGNVGELPETVIVDLDSEPGTVTFTIQPTMEETKPEEPHGTHDGTLATKPVPTEATGPVDERLQDEISRFRWRRHARRLAVAVAAVAVACAAAWALKGPATRWLQVRAVSAARPEADRVVAAYSDRGLEAGRRAEKDWVKRWMPDLEADFFVACTNRFRAEEVKLLDKEAEGALVDVVAAFGDVGVTAEACEERAAEWRSKWGSCCSPAKIAECENRIDSARKLRAERESRIKFEKFRSAGRQVAMRYQGAEFALDECDTVADRWRKMRPDGFPEEDFAKLGDAIEKARQDRVRAEDRRTAERESEDVVKAYDSGVGAGDKEAKSWRKRWGKRLASADFEQMNAQIASARSKRVEVERELRVQRKKKECEDKSRPIIAGYKDDSADKNEVDKAYAKWRVEWMNDRDLQARWLEQRVNAIEKEKKNREARDEHAPAGEKAEKEAEAARAAAAEEKRKEERARLTAGKTNEVVSVRGQLEAGYGNDASDKAELDRAFTEWMLKWSADPDLPPGWFPKQREAVEKIKLAWETRAAALREADMVCYLYRTAGLAAGDERRAKWAKEWKGKVDDSTFHRLETKIGSECDEREKSDIEEASRQADRVCRSYASGDVKVGDYTRNEWISTWTNRLNAAVFAAQLRRIDDARKAVPTPPPPPVPKPAPPPKPVVDVAGAERELQAVVRSYADRASKLSDADVKAENWRKEWRGKLPESDFGRLNGQLVGARDRRTKWEREYVDKTNEVVSVRATLVRDYADDSTDKGTLDGRFESWLQKWSRDVDIPVDWFAGQRGEIDKAKRERERRDEIKEAHEAARKVCASYSKGGVPQGDGSREMWESIWKRRLDTDTFDKLWRMMDDARAARIRIDDEKAFAAKQKQAKAAADDIVRDYGNKDIKRTDTDDRFAAWRAKWEADTDLNPDWVQGRRAEIEKARGERITRDKAEEDRKAAWKDSQNVTKAYASGVDAGESECRRWDGTWKPVLAEADYRKIVDDSIEPARKAAEAKKEQARLKAEAERRKAVAEQLEKDVRALLEVDRDHVDQWRKRLEQAEQKIVGGKSGGVLDERKATELLNEVSLRKNWVVGVVVNQSPYEIEVAQRPVKSGQREFFEFRGTMPVDGLLVTSAGYKPLTIDEKTLGGSVVQIGAGKWKLEPIPRARVRVPVLEGGVACLVDGVERTGDFELAAGNHAYVYRLKDHKDQKSTFSVNDGETMQLPDPGEWQPDDQFIIYVERKLSEIEQCLEVKDGELSLRIYHEIWKKGYRLTEEDKANIEEAYEICKKDYEKKLRRAIDDPRFDETEVRRWWAGVLALYYDLTGKR